MGPHLALLLVTQILVTQKQTNKQRIGLDLTIFNDPCNSKKKYKHLTVLLTWFLTSSLQNPNNPSKKTLTTKKKTHPPGR